jgi:hypothetical protein
MVQNAFGAIDLSLGRKESLCLEGRKEGRKGGREKRRGG